jgi:hypothetical protein
LETEELGTQSHEQTDNGNIQDASELQDVVEDRIWSIEFRSVVQFITLVEV